MTWPQSLVGLALPRGSRTSFFALAMPLGVSYSLAQYFFQ
jgi:hypothetical protein